MNTDLSDADVAAILAGETTRGPRTFRGRPLAELSRGLRGCFRKIFNPTDEDDFFFVALLHILAEAHATDLAEKLQRRAALVAATDQPETFRGLISARLDDLSEDDVREAIRIGREILDVIEQAEVTPAKKNAEPASVAAEPSPMKTPSSRTRSPKPTVGRRTSPAGK